MKSNKTITKNYQGITYKFTKSTTGYTVTDGYNMWTQSNQSVREAKKRRDN